MAGPFLDNLPAPLVVGDPSISQRCSWYAVHWAVPDLDSSAREGSGLWYAGSPSPSNNMQDRRSVRLDHIDE